MLVGTKTSGVLLVFIFLSLTLPSPHGMTHVPASPYRDVPRARNFHKGGSRHMRHRSPSADGKSASPSKPRAVAWRRHLNPRFSRHCTNRFMLPAGSPALSAQSFHEANSMLELSQASERRWHLSSIQAAMASSASR